MEEIVANHVSDKGLLSTIYKELLQPTTTKKNNFKRGKGDFPNSPVVENPPSNVEDDSRSGN